MNTKFKYYLIEADTEPYPFSVYGYGTYPRDSVLAGQHRRVWLGSFETLEEAQKAYPKAEGDGTTSNRALFANSINMPSSAPDWFDPADAGESWEEP